MRVLFLADNLDLPELHLLKGLADSGIEVEVMLSPGASRMKDLLSMGIEVSPLALKGRIDIKGIRLIRQKLLSKDFDVLHMLLNRQLSNGLLASIGLNIKKVGYRGTMGHVEKWNPGSWLTYKSPWLDRISCVSHAVRNYLLTAGISEKKLVTIYKGHDPSWYPKLDIDLKKKFDFPTDTFLVGCTAAMRKVKGIDFLIKSAHHLPKSTSIRFLLIGEVRDKALLKLAEHEAIGHLFRFSGHRTDAAVLIGNCDLFVMPSIEREGLPKALIEAMAQGVAGIVTRVGGMPEIVQDKVNGLVIAPSEERAIASALRYCEENRTAVVQLGKKAKETIEGPFNIKETIRQTNLMYKALYT